MISDHVKQDIKEVINEKFQNESLRNFFLNHPALETLIQKLVDELRVVYIKRPDLMNREAIKLAAKGFTIEFCRQALIAKEKEILSEQALYQEKLKQDKIKEMHEGIKNADLADLKTFDG